MTSPLHTRKASDMSDKLEDLIDRYFDIACQQGKEGRNHDDIEGSAQATLEAIRDEIKMLRTPAPSPISVGETFTREQMLAEVERRVERALAAREALAPAEHVVPADDLLARMHQASDMAMEAYVATLKPDALAHLREIIDAKISAPADLLALPEMSRRQKNLVSAIREHLAGHDLNEVFSAFLHILSGQLGQLAETEPHIAQRNAHRFGKLLVSSLAAISASEVEG